MALSEIVESTPNRRERILDVAERHFADQPYDVVSTVAIAAEAGVNRGWIHHEFGSKGDLYVAVLRRLVRVPFVPDVADWPKANGGLEAILDAATDAWLAAHADAPPEVRATVLATAGRLVEARALLERAAPGTALDRVRHGRANNRGMVKAALWCGFAAIVIGFLVILYVAVKVTNESSY